MLSYVIPVEDRSPSVVNKNHLQLELEIEKQEEQQSNPKRNGKLNVLSSQDKMAPTAIHNFINLEHAHGRIANGGSKKIIKTHGRVTYSGPAISTESSASSISSKGSDATSNASQGGGATPTSAEKLKPKLVQNGTVKTASLKRWVDAPDTSPLGFVTWSAQDGSIFQGKPAMGGDGFHGWIWKRRGLRSKVVYSSWSKVQAPSKVAT